MILASTDISKKRMIDQRIASLLQEVGLHSPDIEATIEGDDPIFPTPFHLGGVAAAALWQECTGESQTVSVNTARVTASLIPQIAQ